MDLQLPNFKQYNLIYGWNGIGKTTLSKLFDALQAGALEGNQKLQYEIENALGVKYKQGEPFNQKIRVFNQDYIDKNLEIRDGKAKAITLILGDINKDIIKQIEDDRIKLDEKSDEAKKLNEQLIKRIKIRVKHLQK